MKFFNTAGPVNQPEHYKINPLHRWNLEEVFWLIEQKKYFIVHAPRQTGKTSSLLALRDYLNKEGKYFALYVNVEVGQSARHNVVSCMEAILTSLESRLNFFFPDFSFQGVHSFVKTHGEGASLEKALRKICEYVQKPFILLVDEIDSLIGDSLVAVLRQLRAGYDTRPQEFPSSVILCGLRDIKDYRIHTSQQEIITGGSAFNIKSKSLRLGNFTKEEVISLYSQHTQETGQIFQEDCFDLIMYYTNGQPWLVNALAYEVTYEMKENRDPSVMITPEKIEIAKERLILSRQTHLDQLSDKLKEDRVQRIILPMLLGEDLQYFSDDVEYCMDLGLIKKESGALKIANSIYQEVIPRELNEMYQYNIASRFQSPDWIQKEGSICTHTLLTLLKDFWNDNAGIWKGHIAGYHEAAPQLVTQAFLQRVANGTGMIQREYGLSSKRTDLMLKWKYLSQGKYIYQKIVLELKTIDKNQKYETLKKKALEQTAMYAQISGSQEAHLLIFDRDGSQHWSSQEENEKVNKDGVLIEIWKLRHNA